MTGNRFFFGTMALFSCLMVLLCAPEPAHANPKYAALVIDAESGSVLYAANANARRYPASLTKMMTLYLAFEALEKKKFSLDSRLKVSKKAASMPQTNIGLKRGETIKMRDVIRSLVVRSANDSAVVMAETLGGSESKFARMMTKKAKALGMKNTTFRNASGLPDKRQRSTARDLAVLALALKKHFPQYFHFFRTKKFRYKGRTYKTHNKVMTRYPGADGLKTGYIRASGFNLATTARRNGREIVAVVMGGKTSRRRDNHMIDLLDRSFAKLEKQRKFVRKRTLPLPQRKPQRTHTRPIDMAYVVKQQRSTTQKTPVQKPHNLQASAKKPYDNAAFETLVTRLAKTPEPNAATTVKNATEGSGQFLPHAHDNTPTAYKNWGIQVGAFDRKQAAYHAVEKAKSMAQKDLSQSRAAVSDAAGNKVGRVVYRARLANLTEKQARNACQSLLAGKSSCFVFQAKSASGL